MSPAGRARRRAIMTDGLHCAAIARSAREAARRLLPRPRTGCFTKGSSVKITDFLSVDSVIPGLECRDKNSAIEEMAALLASRHRELDGKQVLDVLARARAHQHDRHWRGRGHSPRQAAERGSGCGRVCAQPGGDRLRVVGRRADPFVLCFDRAAKRRGGSFKGAGADLPPAQGRRISAPSDGGAEPARSSTR